MQKTGYKGSEYQAVLLEIPDEKVRKLYGGNTHLLQVWNKIGVMVYQKKIKMSDNEVLKSFGEQVNPIKAWIILDNFIVYMLDDDIEGDSDYIYIVDLSANARNYEAELKITNFVKGQRKFDKIGLINDRTLFVASSKEM
jgi:hypothetical protein